MVDDKGDSPQVTPRLPKGGGQRTPWIILAVSVVAVLAVFVSIGIVILVLRG